MSKITVELTPNDIVGNAQMIKEKSYDDEGNIHGKYTILWDDGTIRLTSHYNNGNECGCRTLYWPNGSLMSQTMLGNNEIHGESRQYNNDGELIAHHWYERGKLTVRFNETCIFPTAADEILIWKLSHNGSFI